MWASALLIWGKRDLLRSLLAAPAHGARRFGASWVIVREFGVAVREFEVAVREFGRWEWMPVTVPSYILQPLGVCGDTELTPGCLLSLWARQPGSACQ